MASLICSLFCSGKDGHRIVARCRVCRQYIVVENEVLALCFIAIFTLSRFNSCIFSAYSYRLLSTRPIMPPAAPKSSTAPEAEYSLLQHLSTRKPKLQATPRSKSRTNTTNQSWRRPSRIAKWKDFDYASLAKCCGGLFCEMLKQTIEPMKFPHLEKDIITFADEAALEKHYISQWTHPIVMTALSHAQRQSNSRGLQPPFVKMVAGGNARSIPKHNPDWAGTRTMVPDNPNQTVNILPGDTKVSYKWKSTEIVPKEVNAKDLIKNWFWPLRQIFTYCMNFETRYGYIISDEEVVAFRVRVPHERLEEKKAKCRVVLSKDRGTIEYVPIYDSTQDPGGEKRLTMNLAVWWLHLLAANNRSIQTTYGPLKDETLGGLGRAPTPPRQEVTPAASEVAVTDRASPATTIRTYENVTDSDAIISPQLSTYGQSFGPPAGPSESFTSLRSSGSSRPKRKRDSVDPEAGVSKLKKGKAKH